MNKKKLLIAIPTYNCAEQIGRVLDQVSSEYVEYIGEILVIDNRSTDNTLAKAIEKIEVATTNFKKTVVRNNENYSLGGSHKVAFQYCLDNGYGGVVILHGDDQGTLFDFFSLITTKRYLNYDCVLGARFMKKSKLFGYSSFRVFGNRIFNWLYSLIVLSPVYDMGSGLNLYNETIIRSGFFKYMPDDLTFNNCMLLASYAHNMRILFEPISWREEDQVSNAKLIKQSKELIKYLFLYVVKRQSFSTDGFRKLKRPSYPFEVMYTN